MILRRDFFYGIAGLISPAVLTGSARVQPIPKLSSPCCPDDKVLLGLVDDHGNWVIEPQVSDLVWNGHGWTIPDTVFTALSVTNVSAVVAVNSKGGLVLRKEAGFTMWCGETLTVGLRFGIQ